MEIWAKPSCCHSFQVPTAQPHHHLSLFSSWSKHLSLMASFLTIWHYFYNVRASEFQNHYCIMSQVLHLTLLTVKTTNRNPSIIAECLNTELLCQRSNTYLINFHPLNVKVHVPGRRITRPTGLDFYQQRRGFSLRKDRGTRLLVSLNRSRDVKRPIGELIPTILYISFD